MHSSSSKLYLNRRTTYQSAAPSQSDWGKPENHLNRFKFEEKINAQTAEWRNKTNYERVSSHVDLTGTLGILQYRPL